MDAASGGLAITSCPEGSVTTPCRSRRWNEAAMKDEDLRRHIAAELSWDPQVDTEGINISTADGTVTLRETVTSLRLKQAGGRAAARVRGVTSVVNELQVELPDADRR